MTVVIATAGAPVVAIATIAGCLGRGVALHDGGRTAVCFTFVGTASGFVVALEGFVDAGFRASVLVIRLDAVTLRVEPEPSS